MIPMITQYALMLQKKSMCPDEKVITQSGGKAYQPILLWKEVNNCHFDVLGHFMPSYASNIFLRWRWRSYGMELMVKNLLNTTSVLYYLIMWNFEKQLYNNNIYKRNCTVFQQHRYASRILPRTWSINEEWHFSTSIHSKSICSINVLSV